MMLVIDVRGTNPVPQGSKTAFVVKGTNRAIVTDANSKALKPWREMVAQVAADAVKANDEWAIGGEPIDIHAEFVFSRPQAHYGAKGLKDSAPGWKTTKPDLDKLVRSVLDSLTGVAFRDDSQVVSLSVTKRFVREDESPGVVIVCYTL